jgi:multidrug efflux system membrane fusion protein
MSGLLLKRNVEIGSLVTPGAPAFVLADTASIKAFFGVPDVTAARLKPGSPLAVTTDAVSGVEFRGRLARIAPSADPKTRVFDVEVAIPNARQQLKVGMVVSLQAMGEQADLPVTLAPLTALLQLKEKDAGYAVFVVEEQNGRQVARQRRVKLGETLGNLVAVTDGVSAGDKVVVSGAAMITDGEQVKVVQ